MRIGKVEATAPFFLTLAWLNYLDRQGIVPLTVAACVFHEFGHYLAIRLVGGTVSKVRLTAIGAEMLLSTPMSYGQEMIAALAGPGSNFLLALLCCRMEGGTLFAGLNLVLGAFNLLPVSRLDGGKFVNGLLAALVGLKQAEWIGCWMDRFCSCVLVWIGFSMATKNGNFTLLSVTMWLLLLPKGKKRGNRTCLIGKNKVKLY